MTATSAATLCSKPRNCARLADLVRPDVRERLRTIWTKPQTLNPARICAAVTRDVAALLAELAVSLEGNNFS